MYEFKKTEDQELLLESLKEVYERNDLDAYFKECDEKHEFPQKAIDVMVDAGFATLGIPEQYGGTEVDILTQCMCRAGLRTWLPQSVLDELCMRGR